MFSSSAFVNLNLKLSIIIGILSKNVLSHMMMNHPSVWGSFDASMENPLNMYTQNWRCHGKQKGNEPALEMEAGGSVSFKVTCGEAGAEGNGGNCANDPNALHNGGGCAISIDYSGTGQNFKTISIASDCPSSSYNPIQFNLPVDMPPCENCACAWTWVPPSSGAAEESYMNCFTCSVKSTVSGSDIEAPLTEFYYVPGGSMPQDGKRTYNDRYPNGPIAGVKAIGTGNYGNSSQTETVAEPPKSEQPVTEPPKSEQPATEPPKSEQPVTEPPKSETVDPKSTTTKKRKCKAK